MFGNVLLIFAAMLMALLLPFAMDHFHDARVDIYEQTFALVTTGAGESTANVTLGLDPWEDKVTSILSVSSNISGDLPSASSYASTGRALEVGGLAADDSRTLTVGYEIPSVSLEDEFDAISYFVWFGIIFYFLAMLAMFGGGIFGLVKYFFP